VCLSPSFAAGWLARLSRHGLLPGLLAAVLWMPFSPRTQPGDFTFLNPAVGASGMGSLGGSQNDLSFANYQTGVIIGYDGMFRTDDGGLSWRRLPLPDVVSDDGTSRGRNWYACRMISPSEIWALGQIHPGGLDRSRLLHSTDGGETWTEALHGQISGAIHLQRTGASELWAMCHDRAFVTRDGGATWAPVNLGIPGWVGLRDVCALTPRLYYAVGDLRGFQTAGFAARSTDGGHTWQRLAATQELPSLQFCQFLTPDQGWAAGAGLWHTADAGQSWQPVALPLHPEQTLSGLRFFQDGRGWVSAHIRWQGGAPVDQNAVLYTYDFGQHWLPVEGGWKQVNAMCWLDPDHGYLCGVTPGYVPGAFVGLYNPR
jgi:photosystem II stability/assembly factor-like uncharacterized protein